MAVSLLQQLNGERAVVLFYIIRILSSTPVSLLPEACSLSLLSLFALCVEISADDDSNPLANYFRTRPGASSGILLGAVTLPGVMISRLIQSLRAFSLQEIGIEEIEYLKLQFWAASAICFTVLVFLCIICRRQGKISYSISSLSNLDAKFSLICLTLLVELGLVSLSWKLLACSLDGIVGALSRIHSSKINSENYPHFPRMCFYWESLLVTAGLVMYFGDMLAYTAARIPSFLASSKALLVLYGIKRSEIGTIIQGVIIGILIFPIFYKYVIQLCESFASLSSSRDLENYEMRRSLVFYASLMFMLAMVVPSWMQLVHSFQMHPLLWVFHFVFSEPFESLTLCAYWLVVIYFSVRKFYNISKNSKTERILLRKYYHLMAVSIFVPALIFQIWKIWPLGHLVHQFMNAFTDHRDSDLLIVSHFSLLLGCALPIWLSSGFTDRPLAPFAGILSLGIGDTMASMVGHKYGVLRWSKTG
ncbi:UNVERIFIED_CONTAM: Dolichol kinase EVAN, partial [Sesamum latifolium]